MRLQTVLALAFGLPMAFAQSSTRIASSAAASKGTAANSTLQTITTTITSLVAGPTGSSSATSFLTLTLTLNTSSPVNTTLGNGTIVNANSTLADSTQSEPWKEGDDWIPFHIKIDPAYGVLGALLILSGIPVAGLGGENRW